MKKIIFSDHALERRQERHISEQEVRQVLEEPHINLPTRRKRRKRAMKTLSGRTLDIIYEEKPNYFYVVTCAILEKEAKDDNQN